MVVVFSKGISFKSFRQHWSLISFFFPSSIWCSFPSLSSLWWVKAGFLLLSHTYADLSINFFLTGSIQGLHNIHGSFNIANMHGALGSRNTAINTVPPNGVQQSGNNLSGGRFSSNNLPASLSQVCVIFLSLLFHLFVFDIT